MISTSSEAPKPNGNETTTAQERAWARAEILRAADTILAGENGDVTSEEHLANYHAALQLAGAIKLYLEAEEREVASGPAETLRRAAEICSDEALRAAERGVHIQCARVWSDAAHSCADRLHVEADKL